MQPCEVCGGMGIDASGYCTQCRTYRGIPGQGYPPGPQTGGYPGPQTGGYPQTGGHAPQTGGYAQQTGYQAPAPVPPKQRSSYTVPLIALSSTLVIVVIAIVAVVLIRDDDPGDVNGQGAVDECVVGTWDVIDYTEDVAVPQVGSVTFKGTGKGATLKFGKTGKGVQDFGSGTLFTGTVQGQKVNLEISGTVTYDFSTNNNTMSFANLVSDGKAKVSVPVLGREETEDFKGSDDPSKYTCGGDKMSMSTSLYRADLRRVSTDA